MTRDYSHNYNVRDSKGRFTKIKKNYEEPLEVKKLEEQVNKLVVAQQESLPKLQTPFEIIVSNCARCGKLISAMKDKLIEKGGLCTVCFLTPILS